MKSYTNKQPVTRRKFLAGTASAIAGISLVPRHVLGGTKFVAPNEKINLAIIGCGGQGQTNERSWPAASESRNRKAFFRKNTELQSG